MKNILFCVFFSLTSFGCVASSTCDVDKVRAHFEVDVLLSKPMSFAAIEARELRKLDGVEDTVPFGRLNSEWLEFKNKYQRGDCVVHFKTTPDTWKAFHGREGYLLVRDGEPIAVLATIVN